MATLDTASAVERFFRYMVARKKWNQPMAGSTQNG